MYTGRPAQRSRDLSGKRVSRFKVSRYQRRLQWRTQSSMGTIWLAQSPIMTVNTPSENTPTINDEQKWHDLVTRIKDIGAELGFDALGISDTDLESDEAHLEQWLKHNYHGEMDYMQRHGRKRSRPEALIPGTLRIISARIDYAPDDIVDAEAVLEQEGVGYVSRYALGRDYHKVLRKKLQSLAHRVEQLIGPFGYRVFTDSAPVLEKALAQKAGLGWIGKHTNLIDKDTGSWFFLGEIYTDLPLPIDQPAYAHCGTCARCIDICPTQAIVAPFQLDARRCISYLTIELKSAIPLEFRRAMGNRIYGCDDCQLVCP